MGEIPLKYRDRMRALAKCSPHTFGLQMACCNPWRVPSRKISSKGVLKPGQMRSLDIGVLPIGFCV